MGRPQYLTGRLRRGRLAESGSTQSPSVTDSDSGGIELMERIRRNVPVCLMTVTKTLSVTKEAQRLHNHASAMPSAHISLSPVY